MKKLIIGLMAIGIATQATYADGLKVIGTQKASNTEKANARENERLVKALNKTIKKLTDQHRKATGSAEVFNQIRVFTPDQVSAMSSSVKVDEAQKFLTGGGGTFGNYGSLSDEAKADIARAASKIMVLR